VLDVGVADGDHTLPAGADRRARVAAWLAWAALVIPLSVTLVVCLHWEPVMRDGWGHRASLRDSPLGPRMLYELARDSYHENPRLGQVLTVIAYSDGPYHVIVTPVLELAMLAMLTAAALGRWPRLRSRDDALAAALVTAAVAACTPQLGPMLLYRPFTWNYLFGFAVNLGWLVPYRLALCEPRPARWWRAPAMCVLGVAAGLCNEHTGVAFAAMAALATAVAWRRGELRAWMIAGLVGLIAGYIVLLTAPGQHLRYAGLAQQAGIVARIVDRGFLANLRVLGALAGALAPALLLVAIGGTLPRSDRPSVERASHAVLALGGVICVVTLLASPKLGPRLYFASVALIVAGICGWLVDRLSGRLSGRSWWADRWVKRGCAVIAAVVIGVVELRLISIHRVVGPIGAVRLDRIEHAPPGTAVVVPRYPVARGRYFLGDDLLDPAVRDALAREFHLASVALEPARP
jgi:Family of unknown function (DUF6056)